MKVLVYRKHQALPGYVVDTFSGVNEVTGQDHWMEIKCGDDTIVVYNREEIIKLVQHT